MKKKTLEEIIEETLNCVDNAQRATPRPFLQTRINANLSKRSVSGWENAISLIGRPSVLIPVLALLICFNVIAIAFNKASPTSTAEQSTQVANDEFSYNVATIYDIENTEP